MTKFKSNYVIIKENNLLIESHSGDLDLESYIQFVEKTVTNPQFSLNMNYIVDVRNVVFTASIDDIEKYHNFTETKFKSDIKRKVAILTKSPNQTVFSTLFKTLNTQTNKEIEVFTTNERAMEWLNMKSLKINDLLDELNKAIK